MLNVLLLAAETEEKKFSPVAPVVADLIWAAVFFILLFLIISKVALPKLNATLAAREAALVGRLQAAEDAKAQANQALAEYRAKLADAAAEAGRIIDEGRRTAEGIVSEARTRAETEAQAIVTRAQADVAAERNRTIEALRSTVADVSIEVAGRIVGKSLDGDAQRSLVDTYIDELSAAARN
jgi:F-type H+-transporting ATPase subunit b